MAGLADRRRLLSAPPLQGGTYTITAVQTVMTSDGSQAMSNPLKSTPLQSVQAFNVNPPRFTLPAGIVHSTYPPQGLGDHDDILPHGV